MKLVRVHAPGEIRLDEVPEPIAGPRDAVVRVAACGICGTDLRYVRQGGLIGPSDVAMPLGHELSGVVEALGAEVAGLRVGDRVVLNPTAAGNMIGNGGAEGGFAPKLLVRNAAEGGSLYVLPDAVPDDLGALAEPLGVGMNAVDRSAISRDDRVVVFGAGPIGLAAIATLSDRGVGDVVAVDLSPRRLEIATALGARAVIDASREKPFVRLRTLHGESPVLGSPMAGSDVYIEASGAPEVIPRIIRHGKSDARLTVVALHGQDVPVSFLTVMMKQMTIRGAMEYPDDYGATIDLLARKDLSAMISHRFPLERFDEALSVAADPTAGGKVMIEIH